MNFKFLLFLKAAIKRMELTIKVHDNIKSARLRKLLDICLFPAALINVVKLCLNYKTKASKKKHFKYNLALCSIIKNEAPYISEWIDYHKKIGIQHLYIYDNDSDDGLQDILTPYIKNGGDVTYCKIKGGMSRQHDAYNDCLNKHELEAKYIFFLDADEFVFCPNSNSNLFNIVNSFFVNQYVGGLAINWIIFGSSGYVSRSGGESVTKTFLRRSEKNFEKNKHIKTVCNPRKVLGFTSAHFPVYLKKFYAINEVGEKIYGPISKQVHVDKIRINHYFTKSKREFIIKKK
nr:glycosyltransferase family 2 protein [Liquorilactobacillus satsumensis]